MKGIQLRTLGHPTTSTGHASSCCAGCSPQPTQAELERNHGTPAEFEKAVRNAWDICTPLEIETAIRKYQWEWSAAGRLPHNGEGDRNG